MKVLDYYYNRKAIQTGILHIGVGNFHRAHQAFYTNQLLRDEDRVNGVFVVPAYYLLMKKSSIT